MGQQAARQSTRQDMANTKNIILFINFPPGSEILTGCINVALTSIILEAGRQVPRKPCPLGRGASLS